MHFWVLFLVSTAAYVTSRISEPDLKAVNFAQAIEGRRLNGSVIKEVKVDSELVCQTECVKEELCQSYNYGTTKNHGGMFVCQLSKSDQFSGVANFTVDEKFKYRGIRVNGTYTFFNSLHVFATKLENIPFSSFILS